MRRVPERIYIRKYCKVPVQYTDFYSGTLSRATMHNCSVDGMYLELDDSILPGTEIEVKVKKHLSHAYRLTDSNGYRVKVMWCKKKDALNKPCFGIGAKRILNDTQFSGKTTSAETDWNSNLL